MVLPCAGVLEWKLRLAWLHKLSPHLRRDQLVAAAVVVMEAVRRFQWLFVRIESELRKLQKRQPEVSLVPHSLGWVLELGRVCYQAALGLRSPLRRLRETVE